MEYLKIFKRFKEKKITKQKFSKILESGMYFSGVGETQHWQFLVIEDQKEKVIKVLKNQKYISNADKWIIILSNLDEIKRLFKQNIEKYALQDCMMIARQMMIKSSSLGIGSNFIRTFDEDILREILRIPDNIFISGIVIFGYGEGKKEQLRDFQLENFVFFDSYGNKKVEHIYPIKKYFKK